jgi:CRP/FNR family cyclic AMP-dependent transcriptional regulator
VALLDAGFSASAARWPGVAAALVARASGRADDLAEHLAIHRLPRIQDRVLAVLWHFAERWGRVTVDGIVLPLPLSHRALATVIGTGRPSVTSALSALRREGLVRRRADGAWLLPPRPPARLLG